MPPRRKTRNNELKASQGSSSKTVKPIPKSSQSDSSQELKNLANFMRSKNSGKRRQQSTEEFERKCNALLERINETSTSNLEKHQQNLLKLYNSIEDVNEDVELSESEQNFINILNQSFEPQISLLSKVITSLNSENEAKKQETDMLSQILHELDSRPERLSEFSQYLTSECKTAYKRHLKSQKLASDSERFKEKYKALMKEAL
ncbi:hypothetical protein O181_009606 [Austropuccinia psidii MF-1]|uniref:Uncharacterized protein n=1 Tax=Austropuccinia psidii MF-1 TaxID=1389203 RepID=A0A9Q3BPK8_9BASI|nr:hypothetical protein [Austropuccinia psidii MF-1]